nr:hypothetical protein [uncultured Fluviicola sp.]
MMHLKIGFLFLISLLVWSCTPPQNTHKVPFPDEPVLSVSEKSVPDSLLPNYATKENFRFDKKGNLVEESGYLEQQRFSYRYKYSFDKMGNCLKTVSLAEKTDSIIFIDYKVLNKEGRLMLSRFCQKLRIEQKAHLFEIKLVERKEQNKYELISDSLVIYREIEGTKELFKHVDRYQDGNLVSSTLFSAGDFLSKTINRYDAQNNLIFRSDSTTSDVSITTYDYDKENRIISISLRVDARGVFNEFEYGYDQYGNKSKSVTRKKGVIDEHDSFINVYAYDQQGNWTTCERRKLNGKLISVLKRKISYY